MPRKQNVGGQATNPLRKTQRDDVPRAKSLPDPCILNPMRSDIISSSFKVESMGIEAKRLSRLAVSYCLLGLLFAFAASSAADVFFCAKELQTAHQSHHGEEVVCGTILEPAPHHCIHSSTTFEESPSTTYVPVPPELALNDTNEVRSFVSETPHFNLRAPPTPISVA